MDEIVASAQVILEGVDKVTGPVKGASDSIQAFAKQAGVSIEEAARRMKRGEEDIVKINQNITKAAEEQARKVQEAGRKTGDSMNYAAQAATQLQRQMAQAFSVVAIEEFVRHSYVAYAETEKSMRRIQTVTGETSGEIEGLKQQFRDLANETGRNLSELAGGFRDFMSRSGLEEGEAAKAFKLIAEAADTAGIDIRDMSRLTGTAMANLKLGLEDMPHLTAEFAKALATLGPSAAAGIEKVTDQMVKLNMQGPKAAETAAVMLESVTKMTGSAEKGISAVTTMWEQLSDPQSPMAQFNQNLVQGLRDGTKTGIDLIQAYVDQYRQLFADAGGKNTPIFQEMLKRYHMESIAMQVDLSRRVEMGDAAWRKQYETIEKTTKAVSEADKQHAVFTQGGIAALNKLNGEWAKLLANVGALLEKLGASKTLTQLANDIENIATAIDKINNLDAKGLFKLLFDTKKNEKTGAIENPSVDLGSMAAQWLRGKTKSLLGYQSGGVVKAQPGGTPVVVGEGGQDEAIVPLQGPSGGMGGGGGTQAEREAAEQWGRLHQQAMATHKHVDLKGQLTDAELSQLLGGGGGGGGGGGRDTGWGPGSGSGGGGGSGAGGQSTTGGTGTPPPLARGVTGSPLGGLHGNLPFGINVDPQRFSAITGLPPSFMNVSPESAARAGEISRGGGVGMGGEFVGGKTGADWPSVAAAGGPVTPLTGTGRQGSVDPTALYRSAVERFRNSPLAGFKPADGAKYGVTTGAPEEWARLSLALGMQESGLRANPPPENAAHSGTAGLYQFEQADLARYGVKGAVTDPNAQMEAMARQFERSIPQAGSIATQSGRSWGGAAAYFGPFRRPNEVLKHMADASRVAQGAGAVPSATASTGPVTTSPITSGVPAGTWEGGGGSSTAGGSGSSSGYAGIQDYLGKVAIHGQQKNIAGMVVHHTSGLYGGRGPAGVTDVWKGNAFGSQFFVDRKGTAWRLAPDGSATWHTKDGGSGTIKGAGRGYGNANLQGIEVEARNDKDVLPEQQEAVARIIAEQSAKYGYDPKKTVFGHGELNADKETTEGMSTVSRIRRGDFDKMIADAKAGVPSTQVAGPGGPSGTATPPGLTPWPSGSESSDLSGGAAAAAQFRAQGGARGGAPAASGTPSPGTPTPRARPRLVPGSEAQRGEDAGLQARLAQADREHAAIQAHVDKKPIQVNLEHPKLGAHRQAFARSVNWARKRTEARRTSHEALVDQN